MEVTSRATFPVEILLEILEISVTSRDRAGQRSAVGLAQSCRALHLSEAGQHARYINALHSHSMSVPRTLPDYVEPVADVLHHSVWPHEAPHFEPGPPNPTDKTGLAIAWKGFLRGSGYVLIAKDHQEVQCRHLDDSIELLDQDDQRLCAKPEFGDCDEGASFRLPLQAVQFAVDQDAEYCVLAYAPLVMGLQGSQCQIVEVRSLQTGRLAIRKLGKQQARFEVEKEIKYITIVGEFLLITYVDNSRIAQLWSGINKATRCASVLSIPSESTCSSAKLLAPNFLVATSSETDHGWPTGQIKLVVWSLTRESRPRRVAEFKFPTPEDDRSSHDHYIACGADLAPGENGLFVVAVYGDLYLFEMSTILDILYSEAGAKLGAVLVLDEDWIERNSFKMTPPRGHQYALPIAVSGWRLAAIIESCQERQPKIPQKILFADLSFTDDRKSSVTELPDYRFFRWGKKKRYGIVYEHPFEAYLHPSLIPSSRYRWQFELEGGMLMLGFERWPQIPTTAKRQDWLRIWRL